MSVSFDPKFIHFATVSSGSTLLNGLISYWKLNEAGAGANAVDEKAANTLTNTSVTTNQAGKLGTCFQFNGASSLSLTSAVTTYRFTSGMTVAAWVKTSTTGAFQGVGNCYYFDDSGWDFAITDGNQIDLSVYDPAQTPAGIGATSTSNVCDGNWKLLVGTFDGTYVKVYVNGTNEATSAAWNHNIAYNASAATTFGARGSGLFLTGYLDDIGVWNRALTQTEITELYNSTNGKTYPF